jgi:hypothetical protein
MSRRDSWRPVLDSELRKWSAMTCDQLAGELTELQAYTVVFDGIEYQVEVEILEDAPAYMHIIVSVDDGTLPASLFPLSESFITSRSPAASE